MLTTYRPKAKMRSIKAALFAILAVSIDHASSEVQKLLTASQTTISQPLLGFGTWNLNRENTSQIVSLAIQEGYRQIDAAAIYGNEKEVGQGIADGLMKANLTRDQIWVTSKLWNDK